MPAKYIMKTDDDAFVRIDEVISSLKKSDPHGLLYGLISFQSSPHRDKDSKWFISPKVFLSNYLHGDIIGCFSYPWETQEWPNEVYPPWAHGPGYIISRDIAKFVVRGHKERTLQVERWTRSALTNFFYIILLRIDVALDWSCSFLSYSNSKTWRWAYGSSNIKTAVRTWTMQAMNASTTKDVILIMSLPTIRARGSWCVCGKSFRRNLNQYAVDNLCISTTNQDCYQVVGELRGCHMLISFIVQYITNYRGSGVTVVTLGTHHSFVLINSFGSTKENVGPCIRMSFRMKIVLQVRRDLKFSIFFQLRYFGVNGK